MVVNCEPPALELDDPVPLAEFEGICTSTVPRRVSAGSGRASVDVTATEPEKKDVRVVY